MTAELLEDNVLDFTPKPTAAFVSVTPELAKRWLGRNSRNRNLRKQDVDRYKRDMLAGRWLLEGSPIRFSHDGTLLDGQHRLTAIVQSNVTVPLLIVRGVGYETQDVMDTGRRRTAADALAINGLPNSTALAAAARLGLEIERGWLESNGKNEVTHSEVLAYIDNNPDIESAVNFTRPLVRKTECLASVVAYTYMVMRRLSEQDAAEFWTQMAEGAGLGKGDPVLTLRNRLAEARRGRERLRRSALLSMVYRAWNARRKGETLTVLRIENGKGGLVPIPKPL